MSKKPSGLGRGLGALMPSKPIFTTEEADRVSELRIEQLMANADQPRRVFDREKIEELAESIREYGIIQPLIVAERDGKYLIVAGERRFRAAQLVGLTSVPCIVRDLSDDKILEISLLENIQRQDLSPLEEAKALETLTIQLKISKTDLAKRLGKSRSYVSNMIRLLLLPEGVQDLLNAEQITYGHARALLKIEDAEYQTELANIITEKGLNVRDIERLVRKYQKRMATDTEKGEKEQSEDAYLRDLILRDMEDQLKSRLQTQVQISGTRKKGRIMIEYYGDEDLERLLALIK